MAITTITMPDMYIEGDVPLDAPVPIAQFDTANPSVGVSPSFSHMGLLVLALGAVSLIAFRGPSRRRPRRRY